MTIFICIILLGYILPAILMYGVIYVMDKPKTVEDLLKDSALNWVPIINIIGAILGMGAIVIKSITESKWYNDFLKMKI